MKKELKKLFKIKFNSHVYVWGDDKKEAEKEYRDLNSNDLLYIDEIVTINSNDLEILEIKNLRDVEKENQDDYPFGDNDIFDGSIKEWFDRKSDIEFQNILEYNKFLESKVKDLQSVIKKLKQCKKYK